MMSILFEYIVLCLPNAWEAQETCVRKPEVRMRARWTRDQQEKMLKLSKLFPSVSLWLLFLTDLCKMGVQMLQSSV